MPLLPRIEKGAVNDTLYNTDSIGEASRLLHTQSVILIGLVTQLIRKSTEHLAR